MKAHDQGPVSAYRPNSRSGSRARGFRPVNGFRKERPNYLDVTSLVRSVQKSEGQRDCFRRNLGDCDQIDCPWRVQCIQKD